MDDIEKEKKYEKFLFTSQKRLPNSLLRFDSAGTILEKEWAIEYDGEQHFHSSLFDTFLEQRKRDIRKQKYCLKNNISILRISYKKFAKRGGNLLKHRQRMRIILETFLDSVFTKDKSALPIIMYEDPKTYDSFMKEI